MYAKQLLEGENVVYGIGMVMSNGFNRACDTRFSTVINLFGFWFLQIPFAWLMAKIFKLGPCGVMIAIPVAETVMCIAAWYIFKKGKRKLKKL